MLLMLLTVVQTNSSSSISLSKWNSIPSLQPSFLFLKSSSITYTFSYPSLFHTFFQIHLQIPPQKLKIPFLSPDSLPPFHIPLSSPTFQLISLSKEHNTHSFSMKQNTREKDQNLLKINLGDASRIWALTHQELEWNRYEPFYMCPFPGHSL